MDGYFVAGMGLRGIERVTEIHHTTVMHWIREAGHQMKDAPKSEEIPEITALDEVQTFVGSKRNATLDLDSRQFPCKLEFWRG